MPNSHKERRDYMKKRMKVFLAGVLVLVVMGAIVPVQTVSAKAAKMSKKDFYGTWNGVKMCLMDQDDSSGRVSIFTSPEQLKTYRGIKVGSKLSTVKSKYGSAAKQKFDTKERFNKYIQQYYRRYGVYSISKSISKWKSYVEYTYQKNTKNDRRLRFYLDKNDKVTAIVYIYKYSKFKLSNKSVDIGFSFKSPSGKKITTKTVDGKEVQVLPANTKIVFDEAKLPEFGVLGDVYLYDTKGRICAKTTLPINFHWYATGTEVTKMLENVGMSKVDPVTGNNKSGMLNFNKLGKYNYFKLDIYDIDPKGGYDKPIEYYFRL